MTPEDYLRVQELFLELQDLSPEVRNERLRMEEPHLRDEVLSLLEIAPESNDFLRFPGPPEDGETHSIAFSQEEHEPTSIGPYRLLQVIGEGGFGTVYLAEQKEPVYRKVALKVIKPGMDSKEVLARFDAERQALALMSHPSIASVIEAGSSETGRPYFVMELVKGVPIHDFCEQNQLSLDERLDLFEQVCHAVHHAHQKGIIHRDLKPANILVAMGEQSPLAKVIDFGIAKALDSRLTEQTLFTAHGQMIGTLEYMSPEQAEMSAVDIDTRSDVYSLGAVLYQLLTGEPPITKETILQSGFFDIPKQLRETDPVTPSLRVTSKQAQHTRIRRDERNPGLAELRKGDLDWIVLKSLSKDRRQRYETTLDLARDIQRFRRGLPVEAHPPTLRYRMGKFVQRHRIAVLASAVILLGTLIGVAGLTYGILDAITSRKKAEDSTRRMRLAQDVAQEKSDRLSSTLYPELVNTAWREALQFNATKAGRLLEATKPNLRGWEWNLTQELIAAQSDKTIRRPGLAAIIDMDTHPQQKWVACVSDAGVIEIRSTQGPEKITELSGEFLASKARFSLDGNRLFVGTIEGHLLIYQCPHQENAEPWELIEQRQLMAGGIYSIDVVNSRIAIATGGAWVKVLDSESLELVREWKLPARIGDLDFFKDQNRIAGAGLDGQLYLLELHSDEWSSFRIDGTSLAKIATTSPKSVTVLVNEELRTWNQEQPNRTQTIARGGLLTFLQFEDGGTVTGSGDGQLVVHPANPDQEEENKIEKTTLQLGAAIKSIARSAEASESLVALADGRLIRLGLAEEPARRGLDFNRIAPNNFVDGVFVSEHRLAIMLTSSGQLHAYHLPSGNLIRTEKAHETGWTLATDLNGKILATIGEEGLLCCWSLPELKLKFKAKLGWGVRDVCVAGDGSWIAAAPPKNSNAPSGSIGIWNVRTGQCDSILKEHENWVIALAASPDGKSLISGDVNRFCKLWDLPGGKTKLHLNQPKNSTASHFVFGQNENQLFIGYRDGWITEWDLENGKPRSTWAAFGDSLTGLAITQDHRVVATSRSSSLIKVHDFQQLKTVASLDMQLGYIRGFQFSSQLNTLAIVDTNGELHIIELTR